jgi:hypothetical protein
MAIDWHIEGANNTGADKAFVFHGTKILAFDLSCSLWLPFPF